MCIVKRIVCIVVMVESIFIRYLEFFGCLLTRVWYQCTYVSTITLRD